jgi:hypothetical protein
VRGAKPVSRGIGFRAKEKRCKGAEVGGGGSTAVGSFRCWRVVPIFSPALD